MQIGRPRHSERIRLLQQKNIALYNQSGDGYKGLCYTAHLVRYLAHYWFCPFRAALYFKYLEVVPDMLYRRNRMGPVRFKTLLNDFNKINIKNIPTETTFLDISGFPHYENVCSNILKFFFSSDELHGLKDLLIQALLVSLEEVPGHEIIVNDVLREQATTEGNRLVIRYNIITPDL